MQIRGFIGICNLLIAGAASAQSYTCPEPPTWDAVPCSMHRAILPEDGKSFALVLGRRHTYYRQCTVTVEDTTAQLHTYNHFQDADWVARQVAKAWAAQPAALRRASMPLIIGVDAGDGDSPVYWDYTQARERSHVIEFPRAFPR